MTHEFSICNELRTLGITANYKGYKQAAWAIHLALDDERRLDDISKEIYQPIAQLFFCYINSVERNLRSLAVPGPCSGNIFRKSQGVNCPHHQPLPPFFAFW